MSTLPTLLLRVGLDAAPLDTLSGITWTDMSTRLRAGNTKRGRNHERARFEAGTASLTLNNQDRALDPTNTASTYYPKIKPGNRVQLSAHRGAALDFDGSNDYASAADHASLDLTSPFTIEGWVMLDAYDATNTLRWIGKRDAGGTSGYSFGVRTNGLLQFDTYGVTTYTTTSYVLPVGVWVHVAAVMDASFDVTFYVNGLAVETLAGASAALANSVALGIGNVDGTATLARYWNGRIDDVRIWSTARTASQVRSYMNKDLLGTETGLVAYWKMDEATGTTVADDSPNSNTLTLAASTATPAWVTGSSTRPDYLITGYAEAWTPRYSGPNDATVELRVVDAFKVLNLNTPTRTPYSDTVFDDAPYLYWRLGETLGTVAADTSGNARTGTYTGGVTLGSDPLRSHDDSRSVKVGPAAYVEGGNVASFERTDSFSLECWFNAGDVQQPSRNLLGRFDEAAGRGYALTLDGYGFIDMFVSNAVGNRITVVAGTPVTDAFYHHLAVTYDGSSTAAGVKIYKDGALLSTSIVTDTLSATIVAASATFRAGTSVTALVQDVAVYASVLSAAQILEHYQAGTTPWDGQTSSARVGAILDLGDWPSADRRLRTGLATLVTQEPFTSTLEAIQDAVTAELGAFQIGADGAACFEDRYVGIIGSESVVTYGDAGTSSEYGYRDLNPDYDDTDLWTQVTATAQDGLAQVVETTASVTTYGRRDLSHDAPWRDDNQARGVADKLLDRYDTPAMRFPAIKIVAKTDSYWSAMLGPNLHTDRVTVKRRPPGGGSVMSVECWVEGIEHSFRPGWWETTLRLVPADATSSFFTVGTSLLNSGATLAS